MVLASKWPPKALPKSIQHASKIEVPKNMQFFIDFCLKNALPQRRRHRFRIDFYNTFGLSGTFRQITFRIHFGSKKPLKNPSKTRSGPFKNRCQKCVIFQRRFFRVSASISEGLGSQVGAKLAVLGSQDAPKSLQNPVFWEPVSKTLVKRLQKGSQGAPDVDFRRIFDGFGNLFSSFSAVKINSLDQNSRYHMYLLSDAIT